MDEISFYITVPASQNPAPQAEVFVWNSTHDLIMSNTFVGTPPTSGHVAPDELVLYGGTDNVVWGNTFLDPPGVSHSQLRLLWRDRHGGERGSDSTTMTSRSIIPSSSYPTTTRT